MQINIEEIKKLVKNQKIQWRGHMLTRMRQRNIKIKDVIKCIDSGEIIEYYSDDYPYPSCLILGFTDEKEMHIVCSVGNDYVWMITTYYPDEQEWFEDMKTRRRK